MFGMHSFLKKYYLFYFWLCVYVWVCAQDWRFQQRLEEGVGSLELQLKADPRGAGEWTWVLCQNPKRLGSLRGGSYVVWWRTFQWYCLLPSHPLNSDAAFSLGSSGLRLCPHHFCHPGKIHTRAQMLDSSNCATFRAGRGFLFLGKIWS